MKIYFGDNSNVDFDGPFEATEEQAQKTIDFFKTIYRRDVVEVDTYNEFRSERMGDKLFLKSWIVPEYAALLELDKDTDELSEQLGRTWMSVDIMRGQWIPRFLTWCKENNKNLIKGSIKKIVKEYVEYLEKKKEFNKEKRKEINLKKRRLENKIKRLKATLMRQNMLKKIHPDDKNIIKAIEKTKLELKNAEDEYKKDYE